jgi:hypothetical protein
MKPLSDRFIKALIAIGGAQADKIVASIRDIKPAKGISEMLALTENQNNVVNEARKRLKDKPWYRGICLDNVPTDSAIDAEGFEKAVQDVVLETSFWDNPSFFGFPGRKQPERTLHETKKTA